jgi:hypothetical protein
MPRQWFGRAIAADYIAVDYHVWLKPVRELTAGCGKLLLQVRETLMKVLGTVAAIVLLAGPAYAQNAVPRYGDVDKDKSPQQIQAERDAEKAYNKSLQNIPEQKSADPWGNVRSDSAPKAAAKPPPAKPKAKTDSAAK